MKSFTRRITIVLSATALSVGLMGAVSPAEAKKDSSWGWITSDTSARDSSWGW
jgi:hypothetical protein